MVTQKGCVITNWHGCNTDTCTKENGNNWKGLRINCGDVVILFLCGGLWCSSFDLYVGFE